MRIHNAMKLSSKRDERGNLVIASGVLLIMVFLSIALITRSIGSLNNVRRTQDFSAGLAAADGGLAEAMFMLDQGQTGNFFDGKGTLGEGTFDYEATKVDLNTWTVKSLGTVNGVSHAIQATVVRDAQYPYAIFTNQQLVLNGNTSENLQSYNPDTGQQDTGNAFIGSNHGIVVHGGGGGDGQHFYTPSGSCSGCSAGEQLSGPRLTDEPIAPTTFQACPAGGEFGTLVGGQYQIDGANGLPYKCERDISFADGDIEIVNGPVLIYVAPDYAVDISGANINPGGKAKNFRLMKAGTGEFQVGSGANAGDVTGVIYAPSSSVTVNGGQMEMNGAVTLNQITVNGGANFILKYDDSVASIVSQDWRATDWHEIGTNQY